MVTFNLLRDLAQKELSECLDKYTGTKVYHEHACPKILHMIL